MTKARANSDTHGELFNEYLKVKKIVLPENNRAIYLHENDYGDYIFICSPEENCSIFTNTGLNVGVIAFCQLQNGKKIMALSSNPASNPAYADLIHSFDTFKTFIQKITQISDYKNEEISIYLCGGYSENSKKRSDEYTHFIMPIHNLTQDKFKLLFKGFFLDPYLINREMRDSIPIDVRKKLGLVIGISSDGTAFGCPLAVNQFNYDWDCYKAQEEELFSLILDKQIQSCFNYAVSLESSNYVTKQNGFYVLTPQAQPLTTSIENDNTNTSSTSKSLIQKFRLSFKLTEKTNAKISHPKSKNSYQARSVSLCPESLSNFKYQLNNQKLVDKSESKENITVSTDNNRRENKK